MKTMLNQWSRECQISWIVQENCLLLPFSGNKRFLREMNYNSMLSKSGVEVLKEKKV